MAELTGAPKVIIGVVDRSILKDTPIGGIGVIQLITKRGKIGTPIFVGDPQSFVRKLGGERTDDKGVTYALRMIRAGAKFYVIRAGHYATVTDKSTLAGTKATATITVTTNNSVWRAEEVGDGYNGTTITIVNAASGLANAKDITIQLTDSDISVTVYDIPRTMNTAAIADFNNLLKGKGAGVELVSIATQIENGTGTLATGAQVITDIVAADWTGTAAGQNGWFVADKITDSYRFANIGAVGDDDVDEGLRAYVVARGDATYHIGTPLGINATGLENYRDGLSPYVHTAHNEWVGRLVACDVNITDSVNRDKTFDIPGVVDVFANRLRVDAKYGAWWSDAGSERGVVISPNNGVPFNLISQANAADFDRIYPKGINPVVQDDSFGTMFYGNRSLWKNTSSLLKFSNVGDLCVFIMRSLRPLIRPGQFDPNNPIMWKAMYRRVLPFITSLEENQAIVPGEDTNWFWQGDQNADRREDAKLNTQQDLDAGKYRARFVFVPIVATEAIAIDVTPTDSNSVKFVVSEV